MKQTIQQIALHEPWGRLKPTRWSSKRRNAFACGSMPMIETGVLVVAFVVVVLAIIFDDFLGRPKGVY